MSRRKYPPSYELARALVVAGLSRLLRSGSGGI